MRNEYDLIDLLTEQKDKGIIVWLCNIGAEKYWNDVNAGFVDTVENTIVNRVEEINLLLCRPQDIMILRKQPDDFFLRVLEQNGFSVPRILTPENADLLTPISELVLSDEKLLHELRTVARRDEDVFFVPYAVTYLEEEIAGKCGLAIIGAPSAISARVNDKVYNRKIAEALGLPVCKGRICKSVDEIRDEYYILTATTPSFKKVIIKEPFGASGKGLYIIDGEKKLEACLQRLKRFTKNKTGGAWLVEGWYDEKLDLNCQMYIGIDGSVNIFSIKRQILRDTVYIGSMLPAELGEQELDLYKGYCEQIGDYLHRIGYTGVIGMDSIVTGEGVIIPIIEINGRFTLSTYVSFVQRIVSANKALCCYMKLVTDDTLGYGELCKTLAKEGLLLSPGSKEGVMLYNSATLPATYSESDDAYYGRLFALIFSDSQVNIDYQHQRLFELVQEMCLK